MKNINSSVTAVWTFISLVPLTNKSHHLMAHKLFVPGFFKHCSKYFLPRHASCNQLSGRKEKYTHFHQLCWCIICTKAKQTNLNNLIVTLHTCIALSLSSELFNVMFKVCRYNKSIFTLSSISDKGMQIEENAVLSPTGGCGFSFKFRKCLREPYEM